MDNSVLTHVGPGTPMGNLLRRFWFPALLESELPVPDGPPVLLRLLGEDLLAFRDTGGRVGIVDAYCPHRRAGLFYGRNEANGLRCVFHGWKFDVEGKCVDMPSEPYDLGYKDRVRLVACKTAIRGGVVWIYMGDASQTPQLPEFEWSRFGPAQRTATKRLLRANWARAIEGGIDSSHISFLHRSTAKDESNKLPGLTAKYAAMDPHPVFDVNEVDYGLLITARRNAEPGNYYWRATQFLLPFYTMIPPSGDFVDSSKAQYDGHAWVPIDDDNTWTWSFSVNPHEPYTAEELDFHGGPNGLWGPVDEQYHPLLSHANHFNIDREMQRTHNFTGINGIPNQDAAVLESMQSRIDWDREHLGHSDLAIVKFRRLLLRLAEELAEGKLPAAAQDGSLYNVRSASVVLPDQVPLTSGGAQLMRGAAINSTEGEAQ